MKSDYPSKYEPLPQDSEVVEYIIAGPAKLFAYVTVNETTNKCEREKSPDENKKCYKEIANFIKRNSK